MVTLACDPFGYARALLSEFTGCHCILPSALALFNHIQGSGNNSIINGYLIHSHQFQMSKPTSTFWLLQSSIVTQLHELRSLSVFVVFVHPDHDGRSVSKFVTTLTNLGWIITTVKHFFLDVGNSITRYTSVILGIHNSTQSTVSLIRLKYPPKTTPTPIGSYLWRPFNSREYAILFSQKDSSFTKEPFTGVTAMVPPPTVIASHPSDVQPLYYLHPSSVDTCHLAGSAVLLSSSLCPPFDSAGNKNLFGCHFRIEFHADNHTFVRAFLPFEFTSCFGLSDNLWYRLAHQDNWYTPDAKIPVLTLAWVFDHIIHCLVEFCNANSKIFQAKQFAAPAATTQAFVSGTISICIPNHSRWIAAQDANPQFSMIKHIVEDPSLLSKESLKQVNYNFYSPLR